MRRQKRRKFCQQPGSKHSGIGGYSSISRSIQGTDSGRHRYSIRLQRIASFGKSCC